MHYRPLSWPLVCLLVIGLAGCSRTYTTQLRHAEAQRPAALRADRTVKGMVKTARIRVYAGHEYRAQNQRWEQGITGEIDTVNQYLVPQFGVRLEIVEMKKWTRQSPGGQLGAVLGELEAIDSGADVDWVVGMVSALSVSSVMEELGVARVPGRHIVMRGFHDLGERKHFAKVYDSLSAKEREEILRARRPHKQAAVFLHEWGHTLGALHVNGSGHSLMESGYRKEMAGFAPKNSTIIAAMLEARLLPAEERSPVKEVAALRQVLEQTGYWERWNKNDYDGLLTYLDTLAKKLAAEDKQVADNRKSGIPDEAKQFFLRARGLAGQGKFDLALSELDGLLQAYPAHVEIRLLACQIWLQKAGAKADAVNHCTRIGEIDPANPSGDFLLARAYLKAGDTEKTRAALDQVVVRLAGAPGNMQKGWEAVLGFYQGMNAITWAEAAMAKAPESIDLEAYRTWALTTRRRQGLPPNGTRFGIDPAAEAEYLSMVHALRTLVYAKKYGEARKLARKGLKKYRNAPGILGVLCEMEYYSRHFAPAQARCEKALAGYSEASWPRYLLGILELRKRRNRVGIRHLEKAMAMDPDLKHAYHALYKAYGRVKNKDKQIQLRERYYERFGTALPTR